MKQTPIKATYDQAKFKRIYKLIANPIVKSLDGLLSKNARYSVEDIVKMFIFASFQNTTLEATHAVAKCINSNMPSSDNAIYHLSKLGWKDILEICESILDEQIETCRKLGLFNKRYSLAVDMHEVPRYIRSSKGKKKREDLKMVIGSKGKNGTNYVHAIITVEIINASFRLTLGFLPVHPFDKLEKLVQLLISKTLAYGIKVEYVLMDRGFYSSNVVRVLDNMGIKYVIPVVKDKRQKKIEKKVKRYRYHIDRDFCFGRGNAPTNLVLVDTSEDKSGSYFSYITNIDIDNEYDCLMLANLYLSRWGIETGYRVKKDMRSKIYTLKYGVRLFQILLSLVLYNQWVILKEISKWNNLNLGSFSISTHMKLLISMYIIGVASYTISAE